MSCRCATSTTASEHGQMRGPLGRRDGRPLGATHGTIIRPEFGRPGPGGRAGTGDGPRSMCRPGAFGDLDGGAGQDHSPGTIGRDRPDRPHRNPQPGRPVRARPPPSGRRGLAVGLRHEADHRDPGAAGGGGRASGAGRPSGFAVAGLLRPDRRTDHRQDASAAHLGPAQSGRHTDRCRAGAAVLLYPDGTLRVRIRDGPGGEPGCLRLLRRPGQGRGGGRLQLQQLRLHRARRPARSRHGAAVRRSCPYTDHPPPRPGDPVPGGRDDRPGDDGPGPAGRDPSGAFIHPGDLRGERCPAGRSGRSDGL